MNALSADFPVYKGHGTENDFVLIHDLNGELELGADLVSALCDRRAGIGADGVLRVVRTACIADIPAAAFSTEFFMDYRNADGSVAEMCGNGLRVFVRYLQTSGLTSADRLVVGTRAGALDAVIGHDGLISVDLGIPELLPAVPSVLVEPMMSARAGRSVLMPNPHVVIEVEDERQLRALDLARSPQVDPPLPHGQNIEFVVTAGDHHLLMRVHERGVGETRSCGTGIGAIVAVRAQAGDPTPWRVDVPGGTCWVRWDADGRIWLTGPAVLVARIELSPAWLDRHTPAAISR
ncbi:MAG: Diaminopimelate epimerase [Pseudonocardiales bacterium]|nr:Diaminopimelate epimerase [Pseudonocardiales bacterium]